MTPTLIHRYISNEMKLQINRKRIYCCSAKADTHNFFFNFFSFLVRFKFTLLRAWDNNHFFFLLTFKPIKLSSHEINFSSFSELWLRVSTFHVKQDFIALLVYFIFILNRLLIEFYYLLTEIDRIFSLYIGSNNWFYLPHFHSYLSFFPSRKTGSQLFNIVELLLPSQRSSWIHFN